MRVVVAEDNALLLEGLTRILRAHGIEVLPVTDADGLRALVGSEMDAGHPVDAVITDVRMPPTFSTEGLEAALDLRRRYRQLPVMVLSQYVEQLYARELLGDATGSIGYLLKDRISDVATFVAAVRQVAGGGTVIDPEVIAALLRGGGSDGPVSRLTEREREALSLMAQGRSNAAIAEAMVVTEKAVGKHIGNIFAKLDLPPAPDDNRRVLAVLAYLQTRGASAEG